MTCGDEAELASRYCSCGVGDKNARAMPTGGDTSAIAEGLAGICGARPGRTMRYPLRVLRSQIERVAQSQPRKIKRVVLDHYGRCCECCGEPTGDHF